MSEVVENGIETSEFAEEAISQDMQYVISMYDSINDFWNHLKSHPRTILSAKFGDGKSFFLSKFEEEKKDDCLIITLHPVNYQVVENKDIFELIKRDILFQITVKGMLVKDLDVNEKTAWLFFIQNNFMGLTESTMSFLSLLQSPPEMVSGVLNALKTHEILKDLRKEVLKIKKKYKSTDALEAFMNKCDTISVLEVDLVTKIIQDSIDDYKEKNSKKRVILVIEDMDRLDPAHLFRILNVFSAHLDTNEKYFVKSNGSYFYNKFHFDNVVFVMDFNNTRNIFKHFYGADTDFEGYIEKYAPKGFYEYSFKRSKYVYYITRISSITDLPQKFVSDVLKGECFEKKSTRFVVNSYENVENQITSSFGAPPDFGILKLYAIMKNLGVEGKELVRSVKNKSSEFLQYILPFLLFSNRWKKLPDNYHTEKECFLCSNLMSDKTYSFIVVTGYDQKNNLKFDHIESTEINELVKKINQKYPSIGIKADLRSIQNLQQLAEENNFENLSQLLDEFVA